MLPKLVPLRIDLFIPDQTKHPASFREDSGSSALFCTKDERVRHLGITQHILKALEYWTARQPHFEATYNTMPFGSRLVLENMAIDYKDMKFRLIADFEPERQILSKEALNAMWNLPRSAWPLTLSLNDLVLLRQLHDTISVVQIPGMHTNELFVFKSAVYGIKHLFHELKLLITMDPHPNVLPKPLYIVTMEDRYGGSDKVCGFILKYYPKGNLAEVLSSRAESNSLNLKDQFRWARQVASTLIWTHDGPARFYSELKVDNLLVSEPAEDIVFIDFEQIGNWISFSAPEIHYLEYLSRLAESDVVPRSKQLAYREMLAYHIPRPANKDPKYDNPPEGYYNAWNMLSRIEQEAAASYSLGKTLWCIFEGCNDTRNSVLRMFKHESGLEFPQFRRTPARIQELIRQCTQGSPDWLPSREGIIRVGSKVYPRGKTGRNGEPTGTAEEAMKAARQMWETRVQNMEDFLHAKDRWQESKALDGDEELLGFMLRPKLSDALKVIVEEEEVWKQILS